MVAFWLLVLLAFCSLATLCSSSPHSRFKHFDTLKRHHLEVSIRERRSTEETGHGVVSVTFSALQRRFAMSLTPGSRVVHPEAKAYVVDENGRKTPFDVQQVKFYTGSLDGEKEDTVDASEADDVWMFHIHTAKELISVEPMNLYDNSAPTTDFIVYSEKDVRQENQTAHPFCTELPDSWYADKENTDNSNSFHLIKTSNNLRDKYPVEQTKPIMPICKNVSQFLTSHSTKREKRSLLSKIANISRPRTECGLLSVVDYTFYQGAGRRNPAAIIQTMQQVYSFADRIFRATDWGEDLQGVYGIVLMGFLIHTHVSGIDGPLYNTANASMNMKDMIMDMSKHFSFKKFCLVHLTVQRSFDTMLGLASRARIGPWNNGICSGARDKGGIMTRNVGMSTVLDTSKSVSTMKAYATVVAHEVGHNWGSPHDPEDSAQCAPTSEKGGKFLMWPYSGLGKDPNSRKFSPCSKKSISGVLKERAFRCFRWKLTMRERCGNGIVDSVEDCDPGFEKQDKDPCCHDSCRFRRGAECSFHNHPCCTAHCRVAGPEQKCYPKGGLDPCYEASYCTGQDALTCPPPLARPNGSPCDDNGTCWHGRCMSFCERKGRSMNPPVDLRPCECEHSRRDMCMHCCFEVGGDSPCQVTGGPLKKGARCLHGVCQEGTCVSVRAPVHGALVLKNENQGLTNTGWSSDAAVVFYWTNVVFFFCTFIRPRGSNLFG